jgi:transposase-like protein
VEGLFRDGFGQGIVSKNTVSRLTTELNQEFEAWRNRGLSGVRIVYLFLDGIYLPVRQGTDEKEGVLCAYGALEDGRKLLLRLALGNRESYESWVGFLEDMAERGLREPLLAVFDGNPGLKKASKEVFPRAHRQRCQAHKMRNMLCKLPKGVLKEIKLLAQRVSLAPSYAVGLRRGRALINRFKGQYSAAMECLEKDLEERLTYLKFPRERWRSIRATNLLERTLGRENEGRR